jgi:hypothetical protein
LCTHLAYSPVGVISHAASQSALFSCLDDTELHDSGGSNERRLVSEANMEHPGTTGSSILRPSNTVPGCNAARRAESSRYSSSRAVTGIAYDYSPACQRVRAARETC